MTWYRPRLRIHIVSLLLAVGFSRQSAAQTQAGNQVRSSSSRAAIEGVILDESDRPVGNAVVLLPSLQRSVTTNDSGAFALRELPATALILQVRRLGYRAEARRVDLTPGQSITLRVKINRAPVTVDEVIVTGSAVASDRRGAQDVAALNENQLRASATGSIGKTLERLPGVSNMSGGPAAGNPVLRGLSQGRVRIVRDGVPQESFEASPRWFPPGNLSSVDRIEVIRGPASILYGSNALGGAINIVPRPLPTAENNGPRLYGLIESQYFTNNDERYGHAELAGATEGIGLRVGGARRVAGDFHTPSVTPYAVSKEPGAPKFTGQIANTNYDQSSAYAQVGTAGGWGNVRAAYDWWDGNNNFPNANGKPAGVHARNDDVRIQGNLVARTLILKPSIVVQRIAIQRAATIAKTYEVAADSNLWDQDLVNRVVTARLEAEHPVIRGFRGTFGGEYSRQRATTRLSQIQPSGTIDNVAGFAFEEYRIGRLTLSSGVRGDSRRQRAASGSLVNALPSDQRAAALNRAFSVLTGSAGGAFQATDVLSLSVNASTGFRAPSFLDLYTNENRPSLGGWVEGNPAANPERSTSSEAGLHYTSTRLLANVVAYHNAFSNFTYLNRTARTHTVNGAALPVFATEQADAHLTGIELSGTAEVVRAVVLDGSYSRIVSKNLSTGEQLPLMPADQLRAAARVAPRAFGPFQLPYLRVGVKHAWHKSVAGPTEPFSDGGSQGFGVAATPAYTLVDAGFGGGLTLAASTVELHVDVENLLSTAYRDFLDTQKGFTLGPGRNVGVRLAVPLVLAR